jgi:iron only hydrogenase large subunit-like protein
MIEVQLENTDPSPSATKSEFKQIRSDAQRKTAKVTLADCLACSGCITSAETVLVMQQSLEEFFASFAPSKVHVVTLSPQSRAALAVKYNLTLLQVAKKLTTVMKQLGVSHVFDSSFALDISLIEAREEFLQRYRNSKTNSQPSAALPVLTSECPGWICYAEKAQGHALPSVSAVKSPQQIMGSLVKLHLAKSLNVTPDQIYHVTVMPCYDKKLEASRPDFFDEQYQTRDVDCVLATSEIEELFVQKNIDFASVAESPLDTLYTFVQVLAVTSCF